MRDGPADRKGIDARVVLEALVLRRDGCLQDDWGYLVERHRDPDAGFRVTPQDSPVRVENYRARGPELAIQRPQWGEQHVERECDGEDARHHAGPPNSPRRQ